MKDRRCLKLILACLLLALVPLLLSGCYVTPDIEANNNQGSTLDFPTVPVQAQATTPAPSAPAATDNSYSGVVTLPTANGGSWTAPSSLPTIGVITVPPVTVPPVTTTPTAAVQGSLKLVSKGEAVKDVQQKLKALGFLKGSADGDFGEATEAAVKAFQKQYGLTVDGKVGSNTLAKLATAKATMKPAASPTRRPTATPAYSSNTYLRLGDSGTSVRQMQQRLIALGYLAGSADGDFGAATEAAVIAFQKRNCSYYDGVAGPETLKALYSSSAKKASSSSGVTGETLKEGSEGAAVRTLQSRLKTLGYYSGSVDGKYGAATTAAVVAFQSAQGLRVDGKAGPATQRALFTTSSSTDTSKYTTLRPGDSGAAIRQLQTTLKQKGYYTGTIDGDYGSGTTAAVKAFQKKMNITPVDGIAGDKTLTLLYSSDAVDSDEYATLRPGDTGAAVRTMQATLYELGYYDGSRDGVYGATTQDAVRAFQIRNKVTPVDGIAGNKTLTKLYSGTAVAAAAKTTEYKTLRKGDRGDEVVQMQDSLQQLGYLAAVTGYYDDATVAAVRSFQSRNGLSVDGSAGQETLAVLYGSNPRAAY